MNIGRLGGDGLPFKVATPSPEGGAFLSSLLMALWAKLAEILNLHFGRLPTVYDDRVAFYL